MPVVGLVHAWHGDRGHQQLTKVLERLWHSLGGGMMGKKVAGSKNSKDKHTVEHLREYSQGSLVPCDDFSL